MKKIMSMLLAGTMLLGSVSIASAATLKDFMSENGIPERFGIEVAADVKVKKDADDAYVKNVSAEATTVAEIPTFDFQATVDMQTIKEAYNYHMEKAEGYINGDVDLLGQLNDAAVTGTFTIVIENKNGMVLPETIDDTDVGFTGTETLFTETGRTLVDDTLTITLELKESIATVANLADIFEGELEDITFECNGVSVTDFATYKITGAMTGKIVAGDFATMIFEAPVSTATVVAATAEISDDTPTSRPPVSSGPTKPDTTPDTKPEDTKPEDTKPEDTKPEDSTTTTETDPVTGTVTETTEKADGSTTVVETKTDGTVTTTDTSKDGVELKSETTAEGNTTVTATIPEAVESATLPVAIKAETVETAQKISITVEGEAAKVVAVPVENASAGVVVIVENEDGTETILKDAVASNGTFDIEVEGAANIKIADNTKEFDDVNRDTDWFGESVIFVAAREIFNGTAEKIFSPTVGMTRGMLAQVLHNIENNPVASAEANFTDLAGHWSSDAVKWAADKGIVNGYGDGSFRADVNVNREQLVTMLWRYAGSPEATGDLTTFADGADVSEFAQKAFAWAIENGIINGVGGNRLNAGGDATRAQVATMIQRFIENK